MLARWLPHHRAAANPARTHAPHFHASHLQLRTAARPATGGQARRATNRCDPAQRPGRQTAVHRRTAAQRRTGRPLARHVLRNAFRVPVVRSHRARRAGAAAEGHRRPPDAVASRRGARTARAQGRGRDRGPDADAGARSGEVPDRAGSRSGGGAAAATHRPDCAAVAKRGAESVGADRRRTRRRRARGRARQCGPRQYDQRNR